MGRTVALSGTAAGRALPHALFNPASLPCLPHLCRNSPLPPPPRLCRAAPSSDWEGLVSLNRNTLSGEFFKYIDLRIKCGSLLLSGGG